MIKVNNIEIKFKKFPNGETLMSQNTLEFLIGENKELTIDFKYEDDGDLIKLMFVKKYIDRHHTGSTHLYIRYMPYSRMDRSENDSPFTLKYVADFITGLNFYTITVVEPHSDVTPALLDAHAEYINFELIEDVKEEVDFDVQTDYIVFPDTGASKRYSKMLAKNVLVGHKHRNFQTGEIEKLEIIGEITGGRKAIIVDDLSSYGGTFVRTAKELRKLGIEEIYLLVAHAENSIFKGKFKDNPDDEEEIEKTLFAYVDRIFTTDTLLSEYNQWQNKKFHNQLNIFEIEGVEYINE